MAALRQYPALDACLDPERREIVELSTVDLGLAAHPDRGLVVPAVLAAYAMTARARAGRATGEELTAGASTLDDYGSSRLDAGAAVVQHPQVAVLGLGQILDRPWVVGGQVQVCKVVQLSFVLDHRVCDGGTAAAFLRAVPDAVEDQSSSRTRL